MDRSWILRFTLFYACITLGPILLAAGFVLTARLGADAQGSVLSALLPVLTSAPAFVVAIRLLPCTTVSWRSERERGFTSASPLVQQATETSMQPVPTALGRASTEV